MKICFATANKNKLLEIQDKLGKAYEIISLFDLGENGDLEETRGTFEGNSLQKAEYIFNKYELDCFADDSGLVVKSLNGAPGVDSAIYAGEQRSSTDNTKLLLENMKDVSDRSAKFVTIISLIWKREIHQFTGEVKGHISLEPLGENGFGYDPIFIPEGWENTFAQLDLNEKNKISHRAKAIEKLVAFLQIQS